MTPLQSERLCCGYTRASADLSTNWWGGRQIAPGQSIHYSVLKRLLHDEELHDNDKAKYSYPPAKLPKEWKVDWKKLVKGELPGIWEA
jgi:hypothetical protein